MRDNGKYLRLFGTLFFTFIGFILFMVLLLLLLRVFFGILSSVPGVTYLFMLLIIAVPAALFIPVYLIYFRRTKSHSSKGAKAVSYFLFTIALASWAYFFVTDLMIFFKHFYGTVGEYMSYNLFVLSANVLCIFVVGIIQALSMPKEAGWMEKHQNGL